MTIDSPTVPFERDAIVVVTEAAPVRFRPGQIAWAISCRTVENEVQAQAVGYPVGTLLYLIEYEDGADVEIPVGYLRLRP